MRNIGRMLMQAVGDSLLARPDTVGLKKRIVENRERVAEAANPAFQEFLRKDGIPQERIDAVRKKMGNELAAQEDSLSSMRNQMRQESMGRARQQFGNPAVDRAVASGYELISDEPAADNRRTFGWQLTKPRPEMIGRVKDQFGERTELTAPGLRPGVGRSGYAMQSAQNAPDEETLREELLFDLFSRNKLAPSGMMQDNRRAYQDSLSAIAARRRRNP